MCDGPKYIFPMVSHILGVSKFECLGYLGVRNSIVLPKVIGEFLMYLIVGKPFVDIWKFMFG